MRPNTKGKPKIRRAQARVMVALLKRHRRSSNGLAVLDMGPFPTSIVVGLMPTLIRQDGLRDRQCPSETAVRARTVLALTATT